MPDKVRVRFAPSPTGHLHVGGARTALFNWLFARHQDGTFLLRIEDTDTARSTVESESAVLEDLKWLGLEWDEGPGEDRGRGPYRQSRRQDIYEAHASRLVEEGKAFLCYCTDEELERKREEALARGDVPQYDGTCRDLTPADRERLESEGRKATVRLRAPVRDVVVKDMLRGDIEFRKEMLGDFILMRSDGRPTYNFAVVVDDALMEITHVIRAEEHLPNTMRQVLVYEALGYGLPAFAHVSLIVDKDRSKLSKRRGATSVAEFREQGYLPGALLNYLALLGWSPPDEQELMTVEQLIEKFDLSRVSASPAAFDEDKLDWVNAHHIREEPIASVAVVAMPFAEEAGMIDPDFGHFERIVETVRENLTRLSDLPSEISYFFDDHFEMEPEALAPLSSDSAKKLMDALVSWVGESDEELGADAFKSALKKLGKELGVKGQELFMPVRCALTGRTHGPALGNVAEVLGRERVQKRLKQALNR